MQKMTRGKSHQKVPRPRRIGNETYVFEHQVGHHGERYRAHVNGKKGRSFLVYIFPRGATSRNRIDVLRGLTLGDPNLPQIQEHSVHGDSIYVVLPWVPGRALAEYLEEGRENRTSPTRLSVHEALRLFNGFVHLLRRLNHKSNIVHGDLSPANLTVARNPNRLLMIDFGSAWLVEKTRLREWNDGRDSQYAAPELQQPDKHGKPRYADFRSDQFSASVIFYEMLTFEVPYGGAGGRASHPDFRKRYGTIIPPSQKSPDRNLLAPRVWTAIDHAVMTGLNFDPEKRFQNFNPWIDALTAIRTEGERAKELTPASKAATAIADVLGKFWKRKKPDP